MIRWEKQETKVKKCDKMSVKKNLDLIVMDKLTDCIINGEWIPGQIISIDPLAEEYGISRTPIIQAVKTMVAEGMLQVAPNGKILVPEFSRQEVIDILKVRLLLEKYAAELICSNHTINIDELTGIADQCATALAEQDILKSRRLDVAYHKTLVRCAGNVCLTGAYTKVQGQFAVARFLIAPHRKDQLQVAIDEHFLLLRALKKFSYEEAAEILNRHIDMAIYEITSRLDAERGA